MKNIYFKSKSSKRREDFKRILKDTTRYLVPCGKKGGV